MNIAFYTFARVSPQTGGIERVTSNLSQILSKRFGYKCYFFFQDGEEDEFNFKLPQGSLSEIGHFIEDKCKQLDIKVIIDQYGLMTPLISHQYIDRSIKIVHCIHTHIKEKYIIRRLLGTVSLAPWRETLMNLAFLVNTPRRRYLTNVKNRRYAKDVDKIIVLDKGFIEGFTKGVPKDKLYAIPNGIIIDDKKVTDEALLSNKSKMLLFVGRLVQNPKNVLFLCELWRDLYDRFPEWSMIICGDGIDRRALEKIISKYKLPRIEITGYTDSEPYYKEASILLQPSFSEGLSMVLLEGMCQGCVPVMFDVSPSFKGICNPESHCGVIVKAMDKKAYKEACERLMTDDKLRNSYAINGIKNIRNYDLDKIAEQWNDLFLDLCGYIE